MKIARWQAVREVLDHALELPPEERASFVERACIDDEELRREVETLLDAHDRGGDLLEEPVARLRERATEENQGPEAKVRHAGPYRLEELLGRGGMGKVYLGIRDDDAFAHRVAVKILQRGVESRELLRRFRSERQILADLKHPYIAELLDGGSLEDGRPYLVMEHVDGLPIDEYCRRQELDIEQRLRLMVKVCEAVQFAHRNLVVHRDLKPSNILVTADGTPKLLDFGIAKILRPENFPLTVLPTRTGILPMTPEYAAPEQVRGTPVTTATDVYAIGILLFELLADRRPYEVDSGNLASLVEAVCERTPSKVSAAVTRTEKSGFPEDARRLRRRLTGDLDAVVAKALRKEPDRRYASALQLAEDLERHLDGRPVTARRGTLSYVTGKFVRRHRLAVGSLATVFLSLLVFVGVLLAQRERILDQRDHIAWERNRAAEISGWLLELFDLSAPSRAQGERVTARELLSKSTESIDREIKDPALKAELLATIGRTYAKLGLLREGVELLQRAVYITRTTTRSASSPELLERLRHLSEALAVQGNFAQARTVAREVQARANDGEFVSDRAWAPAQLGHLESLQGRYREAQELLEKGLALTRSYGEPEAIARVLGNLGDHRIRAGNPRGAEAAYREGLALLLRQYGDLHPDVVVMQSSLADALRFHDPREAEALFLKAIVNQRKIFEGAHPLLTTAVNNLGLLYFEEGRYADAGERFEEAVALQSELYGDQHPKLALMLGNLANTERFRGRLDRAEEFYGRALEILKNRFGENHGDYALILANLAEILLAQGKTEEAARLADRAFEITVSTLGEAHPRTVSILNTRGQVEMIQGRLDEAATTFEQAIELAELSLGDRHPDLPALLVNLTGVRRDQGKPLEAVDTIRRAVEILEARNGQSSGLSQWRSWLANLELELENYAEAERQARRAFDALRVEAGADDLWTLSVQGILGKALLRLGRPSEAELLLADLVQRYGKHPQAGAERLSRARASLAEARTMSSAKGEAPPDEK